jgi:hypothetical protein
VPTYAPDPIVRLALMRPDEIAEIAEYDTQSSGADRRSLLRRLHGRGPDLAVVARAGEWCAGYVMGREGREVTQLGPLIAEDEDTAIALAHAALAHAEGPVVVDVPAAQRSYVDWLTKLGFTAPEPFVRMVRGGDGRIDQPDYIFSLAGLDFG